MPFTYEWKVRFGDIDQAGLIYYPTLFEAVFDGVDALLEEIGRPLYDLVAKDRIGLPIVHAEADYRSPIRHGDEVTFTYSVAIGESSISFEIVGEVGNTRVCEVYEVHVVVDLDSFESIPVPENLRSDLQRYEA